METVYRYIIYYTMQGAAGNEGDSVMEDNSTLHTLFIVILVLLLLVQRCKIEAQVYIASKRWDTLNNCHLSSVKDCALSLDPSPSLFLTWELDK